MTQPPKEITTPPEGYEWTGEVRTVYRGESFADWVEGKWNLQTNGLKETIGYYPILRKVKPPTVMVELPRNVVQAFATGKVHFFGSETEEACRTALEREADAE